MDTREVKPSVTNGSYENVSSDAIKAEIDHTRERMDHTLEELGERLHPRNVVEDIFDYFRSSDTTGGQRMKQVAGKMGRVVLHQVQEHPLPSLLIGAGLAWMAVEQKRKYFPSKPRSIRSSDYTSDYSESMSSSVYATAPGASLAEEDLAEISEPFYSETEIEFEASDMPETDLVEATAGICEPCASDFDVETNENRSELMQKAKDKSRHLKEQMAAGTTTVKQKGRVMKDKIVAGAHTAKEKAAGAAASVTEAARHMKEGAARQASRIKEGTRHMGSQVRMKTSDAYHLTEDKFYQASENYPFAMGIGFMAIGLLAGLLMPRTRKEDEYLGETADQVREQAKARGREILERGQQAAKAAVSAATEEAKAQGFTKENLTSKIGRVASDIKEAALESARKEGLHTEGLKDKATHVVQEAKSAAQREATSTTRGEAGMTGTAGMGGSTAASLGGTAAAVPSVKSTTATGSTTQSGSACDCS